MILDSGMSEDFLSGFTARHPVEYFFLCTQWWCAQEKAVSKEYPVVNTMFSCFVRLVFIL